LTAVTVSVKDKLTLSLGVAVGSSIVSSGSYWSPSESTLMILFVANRALRHSVSLRVSWYPYGGTRLTVVFHEVYHHPWMDTGETSHSAIWSIWIDCTLPFGYVLSTQLVFGRLLTPPIVLTVNYVVQDGKSNWLEGMILMCTSPFQWPVNLSDPDCRPICDTWNHFLVLPWCVWSFASPNPFHIWPVLRFRCHMLILNAAFPYTLASGHNVAYIHVTPFSFYYHYSTPRWSW
jgi:hypothetical protein